MKTQRPHESNSAGGDISLITKTKTQNQGNQALSIVWRDYLSSRYPNRLLKLFERAPAYLKRFTTAKLSSTTRPTDLLDEIAFELLDKRTHHPRPFTKTWDITHDPSQRQVIRFKTLRRALRLRSRISALNFGATEYFDRLSHLTKSELVVVNPAGEFQKDATDTALHYLLETRCCQLAGCKTAFVNLSFEIEDKTIAKLADFVFQNCNTVEFRDSESQVHNQVMGGQSRATILPDAAILSKISRVPTDSSSGIAVAINALHVNERGLARTWDEILLEAQRFGNLTLTSNEWSTDYPFWKRYLSYPGITCDGKHLSYESYGQFLSQFEVVVASRLHTCILGLVSGAAVVPVETGSFKLTGFFHQLGMPQQPVRMGAANWKQQLFDQIGEVKAERAKRVQLQDDCLNIAKERLTQGLDSLFLAIKLS